MLCWFADYQDKVVHYTHLKPVETAGTIRVDRDEPLITDGPFVEG
jgi:hypothetical protein